MLTDGGTSCWTSRVHDLSPGVLYTVATPRLHDTVTPEGRGEDVHPVLVTRGNGDSSTQNVEGRVDGESRQDGPQEGVEVFGSTLPGPTPVSPHSPSSP